MSALDLSAPDSIEPRSEENFLIALKVYQDIYHSYFEAQKNFSALDSLMDKEFETEIFENEDLIIEGALFEDYLFPEIEKFPVIVDGQFSSELVGQYPKLFNEWLEIALNKHKKSQEELENSFTLKMGPGNLICPCSQCLGDYRRLVRDTYYAKEKKFIDHIAQKISDNIESGSINQISSEVERLSKALKNNTKDIKYKLKRGSFRKLEREIEDYYKEVLQFGSELFQAYRYRIEAYINSVLLEMDIKPEILGEEDKNKFFKQLGRKIWKPQGFIKKEFQKFIKSIMALMKRDVSSRILKDYLGEFWVHAKARRIKRKIIYHKGPTNSGKTYHAIQALAKAKHGCYLAPLRLLAGELFDTLNDMGVKTSLLTGEEVVEVEGATHYSSTIEMAKLSELFDVCVIDEIQMITDSQRGWAWTRALVNLYSEEIHICGDGSVLNLIEEILKLTGDTLEVRDYERMTDLVVERDPISLNKLKKNDALIVFSRRNALKYKMELEQLGFKVSIVYGRLSPEVRREQARKFDQGETDIMVSTDAIAMGMNLPVQRIVFSTLSKFIDSKEFVITPSEIKQIAGRAGRFQRFPTGFVNVLDKVEDGLEQVNEALAGELEQAKLAMVGPDLDIFTQVNDALTENSLSVLRFSDFLRLFNTMTFKKPFYCVELKEMIEVTEMVEEADPMESLSPAEVFGFSCAPVNLGLIEHVQYFVAIVNQYVGKQPIINEPIDADSTDIDYLERAIKCVELYQWLARHFGKEYFQFDEISLLTNKTKAVEKLNDLLSEKTKKRCFSCSKEMPAEHRFNICEECFKDKRYIRKRSFRGERSNNSGSDNKKFKKKGNKSSGSSGFSKKKNSKRKNKAASFKKYR